MNNAAIAKRILVELTQEDEMFRAIDRVRKNGDAIHARVRVRVAQQIRDIANRYAGVTDTSEQSSVTTEAVAG